MRLLPAGMLDSIRGSAGDVAMRFNVWYDKKVAYPDVKVQSWALTWNEAQQTKGQGSFAVLDPDGFMLPWGYDDPLSVGGGMMQAQFIAGGLSANLAFQRITRTEPQEQWRLIEIGGVKTWIAATHQINIQADDLTTVVSTNQFLAPETPANTATVFSEIRRICSPYMDVIIDPALTDRAVPATIVYNTDRMQAVQALADAIDAGLRVTGGGQLSVYKRSTTSSWTVLGGSHDANLENAKRSFLYSGLYNGVISKNVLPDGSEIQGTALQSSGPLSWYGPHGHVPYFHQASFAQSQLDIDTDAQTQLQTLIRRRSSNIPFTALFHPGIETGDMVTINLPLFDGSEQPVQGIITQVSLSGSGNSINPMASYAADIPDSQIVAIAAINRKKKWGTPQ